MSFQELQLGQAGGTTLATSIYSPATSTVTGIVKTIIATGLTTGTQTFSVYLNAAGTTYDDTTVLFNEQAIRAKDTIQITTWIPLNTTTGNLAVQANSGSINFTVTGAEATD